MNSRARSAVNLEEWADYERMERGVFPEDALTATGALGIQSYFLPDLRVVDGHGLVDAVVARNPVASPNSERLMAHDRRPPPGYVLEERGVNLMALPSASSEEEALARGAYALQVAPDLWMPFDAADHDWVLERFDAKRLGMRPDPESRWELQVAAIESYESGPAGALCEPAPAVLCLQGGRYQVTLDWSALDGRSAAAPVSDARTAEAGLFFFFAPANWEVLVKVLDGCEVNGHHWPQEQGPLRSATQGPRLAPWAPWTDCGFSTCPGLRPGRTARCCSPTWARRCCGSTTRSAAP